MRILILAALAAAISLTACQKPPPKPPQPPQPIESGQRARQGLENCWIRGLTRMATAGPT